MSNENSSFRFEYYDSEATSIDMTVPTTGNTMLRPTVFTNKNFVLSGVTLYTDEFSVYKNSRNSLRCFFGCQAKNILATSEDLTQQTEEEFGSIEDKIWRTQNIKIYSYMK